MTARTGTPHILVLGGSPGHVGGLEAVCDRAIEALQPRDKWRISRLPTNTAFLTVRRLPRFCGGLARLVRVRWQRPDCVWLHYVNLPDLVFLALARMLGMRVIVTPHLGTNWRSQTNTTLRNLSRWLLGFSNRIALLATTQELEVGLPEGVPRSYIRTFLPATIMARDTSSRTAPPVLRLLHAARLCEGKGTFAFIQMCERLKRTGVAFSARIAGGADEATFAKVRSMIATCGLEDQVTVLGRKSDSEMCQLLLESDVLVHLSLIDSYPLIVLEAMTCGVLPVCIGLAGARDMVTAYDGELVSRVSAIEETADCLATTPLHEIRRRAADAASMVRADYDWNACAQLLKEALLACVAESVTSDLSGEVDHCLSNTKTPPKSA
jgi:glycosyltransferase involved in cell wall biosynthesis